MSQGVILVTGSASGIGKAIVEGLRAAGQEVVGCDLKPTHDDSSSLVCDVSDEGSVEALFEHSLLRGRCVGVVHVAGIMTAAKAIVDTTIEEFEKIMSTNLRGTYLINRAAARAFKARKSPIPPGGYSIVNFSSGLAIAWGVPNVGLYTSSKGAINAFTRCLAAEVASDGIRVNAVAPGPIDTPLFRKNEMPADIVANMRPMKRLGKVEEMVGIVEFLLSEKASYTTGAIFDVNGGAP